MAESDIDVRVKGTGNDVACRSSSSYHGRDLGNRVRGQGHQLTAHREVELSVDKYIAGGGGFVAVAAGQAQVTLYDPDSPGTPVSTIQVIVEP